MGRLGLFTRKALQYCMNTHVTKMEADVNNGLSDSIVSRELGRRFPLNLVDMSEVVSVFVI